MHCVDMSWKEGDAQLKKEGEKDLKKKAKTTVTWHDIKCKGYGKKKNDANEPLYNFNKLRRSGRTCYFSPQPKLGAPRTIEDNPIDLSDERED